MTFEMMDVMYSDLDDALFVHTDIPMCFIGHQPSCGSGSFPDNDEVRCAIA